MSSNQGRSPSACSSRYAAAAWAIGARHRCGSHCCDPTWNDTPAACSPRSAAKRNSGTTSAAAQPNFPDSGQSDPAPEVASRANTAAPGAASASLAISSTVSAAKIDTPRPAAYRMSARRLIGFE